MMNAMTSLPVGIGNICHIGARESQQDNFAISDLSNADLCGQKGIFAVVADGMGGLKNGGKMSSLAAESMHRYFSEKPALPEPSIELLGMVTGANDEICRFLGRSEEGKSGTTAVAVILKDRQLYWAAVGDSRICLIRKGALLQINREHTFGPELDEKAAMGEISFEEAKSDPQRAAVTSFLGMGKLEKIDRNIRPLQLLEGDRVLLMTDGVFGTLSDEEILSVMHSPASQSAQGLQELVLSKALPQQDNFTAVIIECL